MSRLSRLTPPSFYQGYAENAEDSAYPDLRRRMAGGWAPSLGVTYAILRDVSGRGNDGTLTNMDPATDWVLSSSSRLPGYTLDLVSGSSQYIALGDLSVAEASAFTYLVWWETEQTGNDRWLFSEGSTSSNTPIIGLINQDGVARFQIRDSAGDGVNLISSFTVNDGVPHCLVGVQRNASSRELFVDGVSRIADTSTTLGAILVNRATMGALGRGSVSSFSTGRPGPAMFFDGALSVGDIETLYERPLAPWEKKRRIIRRVPVGGPVLGQGIIAGVAAVDGQALTAATLGQGQATGGALVTGQGFSVALGRGAVAGIGTIAGQGSSLALSTGAVNGIASVNGLSALVTIILGRGIVLGGVDGGEPIEFGEVVGAATVAGESRSNFQGAGLAMGATVLDGVGRAKWAVEGDIDAGAALASVGQSSASAEGAIAASAVVDAVGVARKLGTGGV